MSAPEPQQLIAVSLDDRDTFSRGNSRKLFGYEAFHWGIIIMPETSLGGTCQAFDATDASGRLTPSASG